MIRSILLVAVCAVGTASCSGGREAARKPEAVRHREPATTTTATPRPEKRESTAIAPRPRGIRPAKIRALWVDAWGPGLSTATECDAMIAWARANGFNTLLVQVRRNGDAYHASTIEPRAKRIGAFDPLDHVVRHAHDAAGMRVEAWIVANRVWSGEAPPPVTTPPHLARARSDWLLPIPRGVSGPRTWYVDPARPEVRRHLARVASDIARRYRVDAVHLDYIRYPGAEWGFDRRSRERFAVVRGARFGDDRDAMRRWRAEQIRREVRDVELALGIVDPAVELTAAVVAWGSPPKGDFRATATYREAGQEWPRWLSEGIADLVYVMHYRDESDRAQARLYDAWLPALARSADPRKIVIGVGGYLNTAAGGARQLLALRTTRFRGAAIFSYRRPTSTGRAGASFEGLLP